MLKKAVFEAASNSGTDTITLYYKDDVLLKQEAVSQFFVSKMEEKNPLDTLKKLAQKVAGKTERFYW